MHSDAFLRIWRVFSCYSRNFPSVTFSLHCDELLLCLDRRILAHRENYESSRSQKTSYPNRSGGERPIAVRRVPRIVRFRTGVRTDLRRRCPRSARCKAIDLILLGNRSGQNLFDVMASLKATRPDLRIIVTGSGIDEETILKAIASGAKGYVDEAASPAEFAQAIRIVNQGRFGLHVACFRCSSSGCRRLRGEFFRLAA